MSIRPNLQTVKYHKSLSVLVKHLIENKEKISKKELEEGIILIEYLVQKINQIENN
jgi:hypothetical protein